MSLARIPGAYYLEEVAHSQTLSTRALNPFSAVSASTASVAQVATMHLLYAQLYQALLGYKELYNMTPKSYQPSCSLNKLHFD